MRTLILWILVRTNRVRESGNNEKGEKYDKKLLWENKIYDSIIDLLY